MTMNQLVKWTGSKKAEGWSGRAAAREQFEHMAEMCGDIAKALDSRRDVDANELLGRLRTKLEGTKKMPCFGGR